MESRRLVGRGNRVTRNRWRAFLDYKDSGVEWLPRIPAHWQVRRLRYACDLNPPKSELRGLPIRTEVTFLPMESVGEDGSLALHQSRTIGELYDGGYTYFRDGDVIVAKITPCFENLKGALCRGLQGGIGFGTTELYVLRPRAQSNARYLYYLSLSHPFRRLGEAAMRGAAGQKRVPEDFVRQLECPLPPNEEQKAIADFLDRVTAKIDALIPKKEHLIELLQEKRTALISQAVTKGLDPNVPTKDSGIEWLEEIPAHWQVKPLKHMTEMTNGFGFKPSGWGDQGIPIIRIENLNLGTEFNYTTRRVDPRFEVGYGDLLFGWSGNRGTSFGPFVWRRRGKYYLNQHIFRLSGYDCDAGWLYWALKGVTFYVEKQAHGIIGLVHITRKDFGAISLPVVPVDEQRSIAEFLDRETAKIDGLAAKVSEAIDQLREYRTALISAAVTGKIDVREVAS